MIQIILEVLEKFISFAVLTGTLQGCHRRYLMLQ